MEQGWTKLDGQNCRKICSDNLYFSTRADCKMYSYNLYFSIRADCKIYSYTLYFYYGNTIS